MVAMDCKECGEKTGIGGARGRRPSYCSNACRQRAYRRRRREIRVPDRLTALRRWTRADGKRPVQANGKPASTTNPSTWATHADVLDSTAGNGYGFMLGDGVVCIDLDNALQPDGMPTPTAQAVLDATLGAWTEHSLSGTGLHIFGAGFERAGHRLTSRDGTGIEVYTRERFIRMTGKTFRPGGLPVLELDEILTLARNS